jgi:two-component system sensor histidine kinase KdpD
MAAHEACADSVPPLPREELIGLLSGTKFRAMTLTTTDRLRAALPKAGWLTASIVVLIAAATLVGGYVAHLYGRPVTAAILAVLAVTSVGALLGLRAGVLAGVCASIAYNLLFTDPYLRFSLETIDDLVPIIALNVSALASGLIAGRLHDRAVAAEAASRRVAETLRFSQSLQRALALEEIGSIARQFLGRDVDILLASRSPLDQARGSDAERDTAARYNLEGAEGHIGWLRVPGTVSDAGRIEGLLPILAMAIQRCELASELAEAELVRRSERFKTTLLSSVSHDVRTPLAAIAASAGSLASSGTDLDERSRLDLLANIQEQCDRLDRLTTNLLNLGRIEAGLDFQKMPVVDAVEVLGAVLGRIRRLDGTHRFERKFAVASAYVRADEALLEQLFYNVLENSIVHTPPETLVRVSAGLAEGLFVASIEDDGPGIAEHERDRIFERFYQTTNAGRPRSGSGLGLSIARGFVENIGGTMRARRPDSATGMRIEITIPLADVTDDQEPTAG